MFQSTHIKDPGKLFDSFRSYMFIDFSHTLYYSVRSLELSRDRLRSTKKNIVVSEDRPFRRFCYDNEVYFQEDGDGGWSRVDPTDSSMYEPTVGETSRDLIYGSRPGNRLGKYSTVFINNPPGTLSHHYTVPLYGEFVNRKSRLVLYV